jgi:hypothetical protein
MTDPDIPALEALSCDYSEAPRRVLFVLGSGQSPAVEVFEAAAQHRSPAHGRDGRRHAPLADALNPDADGA